MTKQELEQRIRAAFPTRESGLTSDSPFTKGPLYNGGIESLSHIVVSDDEKAAVFSLGKDIAYHLSKGSPCAGGGMSYYQGIKVYDSITDTVLEVQPLLMWRDGEGSDSSDKPENHKRLIKMIKTNIGYDLYLGLHDGDVSVLSCDFIEKKVSESRKMSGIQYLKETEELPTVRYALIKDHCSGGMKPRDGPRFIGVIDRVSGEWTTLLRTCDHVEKEKIREIFSQPDRYALITDEVRTSSMWGGIATERFVVGYETLTDAVKAAEHQHVERIFIECLSPRAECEIKFKVGDKKHTYSPEAWRE